ncbi:MAG TPA: DUF4147 domain-containing protein [Gammaproteobacteria bacterium]
MTAALAAVEPSRRVVAALQDFQPQRVALLALGKAASGMARGAHQALAGRIENALVVAPAISGEPLPEAWQIRQGDHPLPGADSLRAGAAIASWLEALEPDLHLLVLLSGGGSALAELPVDGMTLDDLEAMNRWLLASGLDISGINAIRARFSRLKQGGLMRLAGKRDVTGLVMSDVPGDRIAAVAAGPLSMQVPEWPDVVLPGWLQALHVKLPPPSSEPAKARADLRIVARNADALDAIEHAARGDGIASVLREALSGDAVEAGICIGRKLCEGEPGVYLFGGETSVTLPAMAGNGGRNQHLALAAAGEIAGRENIYLLALGTDGIDGNTEDAGALVDGRTIERIRDAGRDARACIEAADSNTALAAAGDVIHTGATGTNVADIVIGLKAECS